MREHEEIHEIEQGRRRLGRSLGQLRGRLVEGHEGTSDGLVKCRVLGIMTRHVVGQLLPGPLVGTVMSTPQCCIQQSYPVAR